MGLVQGPFLLQDDSAVAITPGVYTFLDDVDNQLGDLTTVPGGWDPYINDLDALSADPVDPTDGIDVLNLLDGTYELNDGILSDTLGGVLTWLDIGDSQLAAAVTFAPAEAWSDPTTPFVPPGDDEVLAAPTVPVGTYNPAAIAPVGSTTIIPGKSIALYNVTRPGSSGFVVGDQFRVAAFGPVGSDVSAYGTLNGEDLGQTDFGQITSNDDLLIDGTMGPDNVGAWREDWYVGGEYVVTLNFIVAPGN